MEEFDFLPKHWKTGKLEDLLDYIQPTDYIVESTDYSDNYKTPVLTPGKSFIKGYTNETHGVFKNLPVIIFDDFTTATKFVTFPFKVKSSAMKILSPKTKDSNIKFAFYYMQTLRVSTDTHKRYWISVYAKIKVPLPPPLEQELIVSKIEELLSDLENGKQQLLTAREQLKVYRQSLLKWAFEGKLTENWRKQNLPAAEGLNSSNAQKGSKGKSTPKVHGSRVRIPIESHSMAAEPVVGYVPKEGTELGELPEGWQVIRVGDVCECIVPNRDKPKSFSGNIKWVTTPNLAPNSVRLNYEDISLGLTETEVEEYNARVIPVGGVIMTCVGTFGLSAIVEKPIVINQQLHAFISNNQVNAKYLAYCIQHSKNYFEKMATTTTIAYLNKTNCNSMPLPLCSLEEQKAIVDQIESKLTVCDKIEETIESSLQQAETLKQSILKQAFEGRLVAAEEKPAYKPKNVYFYQMQLLGYVLKISKEKNISHGEMTTAKYMYLIDRLFKVPTHYKYERWHLGPYPPEMKKAVKNKKFFGADGNELKVVDEKSLFKYNNPYEQQVIDGIGELAQLFGQYVPKERPHQTELLATVCKVIEDIQSTDLAAVRQSMKEWKIDLKNTKVKNKAEKFNEADTAKCLNFVMEKSWDIKLISNSKSV